MILKSNELRIGNYLNYTVNGDKLHLGKVTLLNSTDGVGTIDYHYPISFAQPIQAAMWAVKGCNLLNVFGWRRSSVTVCLRLPLTLGSLAKVALAGSRNLAQMSVPLLPNCLLAVSAFLQ
jgi:hypothetical protein